MVKFSKKQNANITSNIGTSMMNTVANNIQLCTTSQSRKLNSLAFILECLFCFCIVYNFNKTGKCQSRSCIPKRISAASLPIVRIGTCVTLVLQLATLLKDAFYPTLLKTKDSGPRWGTHSAPPDPLAGFKAVSP